MNNRFMVFGACVGYLASHTLEGATIGLLICLLLDWAFDLHQAASR